MSNVDTPDTSDKWLQALREIQYHLHAMATDHNYDPHISTLRHLEKLSSICDDALESAAEQIKKLDIEEPLFPDLAGKTIVSCDASITENPGGMAATGIVIRFTDGSMKPWEMARHSPAKTNNQAEYDAVYEALGYFRDFGPGYGTKSIEIRTDSKLVVNQMNGKWEVNDETLKRRHESVTETLTEVQQKLGIPIKIVWFPRNSTDDLKKANHIAQDFLGVKNH